MFGGSFFSSDDDGFSMMSQLRSAFHNNVNQRFDTRYRCYPVAMIPGEERPNVNYGGKVILPPSALEKLSRLNVSYPMLFDFENEAAEKKTHGGVLEFIAEEGRVYLPYWMMTTLSLEPGDLVRVINTDIAQGSYVKLQPQSVNFLDITDHRAVLENALRNFSTLTKSDIFEILYNDQVYQIKVIDVQPDDSRHVVSVVETDLVVDFDPPIGYEESLQKNKQQNIAGVQGTMVTKIGYDELVRQGDSNLMKGTGTKLNGKEVAEVPKINLLDVEKQECPAPLILPLGTYFFGYPYKAPSIEEDSKKDPNLFKFEGAGTSLRASRKTNGTMGKGSSDDPIDIDA
ncbi:Hrd1 ubiquitin ligase complex subunit Ufd1 [Schizosaccharomyces pombe]|uniref:Ubiquitin fusion degradation protein 1 n=1 Tax=Schizosaccharomyces pombe (strain 972 / ATCC 24843) TaxID=284812 RepID=UFD1_SCHPO|eukprot:NP_596780.1 putative Cdc48-Npl4-Ufd1 complex subunit Npl4 [Schizosaccharomyces pombe]